MFRVGDIISGTRGSRYTYTDHRAVMEVISLSPFSAGYDDTDIVVEIIEHENKEHIGDRWDVTSKYFNLKRPTKPITPFKGCDLVAYWG